jgi:hypothetical protein
MEQNPFPEIRILPTLKEVGSFIGRVLSPLPREGYPSEYPKHPERRGVAIQDQLPFGYDSEGRYIDPAEY